MIKVHHNDKEFRYKLEKSGDEWENDDYLNLIKAIKNEFNLNDEFTLYKNDNGKHIEIDDMDDIIGSFENDDDDNNDDDSKQELNKGLQNKRVLNLYISV